MSSGPAASPVYQGASFGNHRLQLVYLAGNISAPSFCPAASPLLGMLKAMNQFCRPTRASPRGLLPPAREMLPPLFTLPLGHGTNAGRPAFGRQMLATLEQRPTA